MKLLTLFLLIISFKASITKCQNVTCNSNDLRALVDFSNCLKFDGWDTSASDCCSWTGITCDKSTILSKRVVGLELTGKRLTGTICKSLEDLDQLRALNFSHNFLGGYLPAELFRSQNLEVLDLSNNEFAGPLPEGSLLSSLRHLDISMNNINGSIDAKLCESSPRIQLLNLANNHFTGEVPVSFGRCASVLQLFLGSNELTGSLPESLFQLSDLRLLHLQDNQFSGRLNDGIGNLSDLVGLDISDNRFSGSLPDVFDKLGKLEHFSASSNKFGGLLPKSLVNSPSISTLNLNNNTFNGPISLNCSAMVRLTSLDLGSNNFQGPVPESISACQNLSILNLSRNKLGGELPHTFKNLQTLTFLSLSNISLTNLSGALGILQHCGNLSTLVLSMNFWGEEMPGGENFQLKSIRALAIPYCYLRGSIPPWLKDCEKLQVLDLSWNHLAGSVPPWIGDFKYLFYLDLSNNSLSGEIPKSLTELQTLLGKSGILTKGLVPDVPLYKYRERGGCLLKYRGFWSFPPTLDLSYNNLTGPIWPSFGNLKGLHVLNLEQNRLFGNIPGNLSEMSSLESLDLSHNNLSGEIPPSLQMLSFLSELDVAYNHLKGEIPSGGQFMTFPYSSFDCNDGLCGGPYTACHLAAAPPPFQSAGGQHMKIVDLPFGIGAAVGFCNTVAFCFISGWVFPKLKDRVE